MIFKKEKYYYYYSIFTTIPRRTTYDIYIIGIMNIFINNLW